MARLSQLSITNYRSINEALTIDFPSGRPLVLLGENNAGKSNVVKALNLVLGQFWPGSYQPEDNEFFGRVRSRAIDIRATFDDDQPLGGRFTEIRWRYEDGEEPMFKGYGPLHMGGSWIKNQDRDSCMCMVIEAERNLRYQLSYSSKYTFLSRLMHKFHQALNANPAIKAELELIFEQTKTSFRRLPEFATFVDELQAEFAQLVESMTNRLEVDFEAYNPVNFFHALDVHASDNGQPRTLAEMGTGEQQILAMAFAHAYARAFHAGVMLVIEEPESHLHPLAQQWLAFRLDDMCNDGLQVVITTHSPHFVDVLNLEGLVLLRKRNGRTEAVQRGIQGLIDFCEESGVPSGLTTAENILPFYAVNATREIMEGFFAKEVVLVEGPTETLALPIYLRKVELNTAKEGISVIGVQGKGNIAKWRRMFEFFGIPCYVIFDNDRADDGTASKRKDVLAAIGVPDADHDAIVTTHDWLVEDRYTVFGRDFEHALREHFPDYARLEAEAREAGVDSKPFIARYVAKGMAVDGSPGWERLTAIATRLILLLPD